jgi:hypothetical protein
MSVSEDPIAPWAFRAALSGLEEDHARDILESDRCPQPEAAEDETSLVQLDGESAELVMYRDDSEEAWLQSDSHVSLEEMQ